MPGLGDGEASWRLSLECIDAKWGPVPLVEILRACRMAGSAVRARPVGHSNSGLRNSVQNDAVLTQRTCVLRQSAMCADMIGVILICHPRPTDSWHFQLSACPRTVPLSSPFSAESWHIPQRPPTPSSPSPPGSPPMSSNTDPSTFCQHCTGSKSAASDVAAPPLDRLLPSKIWPATPPPRQHGRLGGALQAGRLGGALHKWRSDSIRTALPLRCDTSNTTSSDSPGSLRIQSLISDCFV